MWLPRWVLCILSGVFSVEPCVPALRRVGGAPAEHPTRALGRVRALCG